MGPRITIDWKSFLLRVEPKTDDRDRFVEYTKSWLRPAAAEPSAQFQVWSSEAQQPASSVPAQVAAKVMADAFPDQAMAYHRRLLEAYFSENRNIADSDELVTLAGEIGVDHDAFRAAAAERSQVMTERVIEDHNRAIEHGVTAVPTVVFADTFPVPGAQDVETYERIVERIAENQVPPSG